MAYPPAPAAQPVQKQGNGFGVTALVLGIIGLVFAVIPVINILTAIPLGVLALIFGIIALAKAGSRGGKGKGTGGTGLVLGILAIGGAVLMNAWVFNEAVDQACSDLGYESQEECDQYLDDLNEELENME
ncbi:hypothetical protein [Glycomyces arizonensis]|uniref:hypothetical protein n=1 Tax=Glycomyces arizonensis TaxID=256035 RepID=UPI0003FB2BCA|nr:hypothetical protein [Glycomyces arizonensis]